MVYLLFVLGFVFLIKGADVLVNGASAIGRRFRISEMVIGLTIVSFGTSLPELLVTTMASINGQAELGLGNILGSNIANVLIILGIAALIRPLPIPRDTYFIEIPFSILAALLLGFLANANIFYTGQNAIGRGEGGIMLYFFFLFMVYIFVVARRKKTEDEAPIVGQPLIKSVLLIIVGVIALYFGGGWVVDGATHIALLFGISESVIGLTIVAVGTSLPELVTSAVAAYKNNTDMAVGNAIGSNIFNILWILGFTSILTPIPFNDHSNQDILMVLISTSALIMAVLIGKKPRISRWEGAIFMLIYCGYLYSLIQR
ncbi:MAG TPA: calcium/sodium antiporter [Cyclobacteriaceae bacterium]|jgi:cation:H+ antiporter|nr:calcium/sodium antiporter [Cytophagales bacterium]HNR74197.1 calcium/sodium antiporter [Cyclobacteriaceae bacterium]HRE66792.1 calcium/sodium antiporter [Cyclobacteriaceae bacterium]HRF33270.1 calcium/sodium antiporter [Cyclobacteriaceae bacterium]